MSEWLSWRQLFEYIIKAEDILPYQSNKSEQKAERGNVHICCENMVATKGDKMIA